MTTHIAFPSIVQFRNIIKSVRDSCDYNNIPYPIIRFHGSVKIHGTNAGIGYNKTTSEMWCQSREQIITVDKDNAGFAFFVESHKDYFRRGLMYLAEHLPEGYDKVLLFGEFAGGSIQKNVAITGLPKFFTAFETFAAKDNEAKIRTGLHGTFCNHELNVFNSMGDFDGWEIDIDFNNPQEAVAELERITNQVEAECPVGKLFGVSGVGEGVVWKSIDEFFPDLVFKVKGEKHSVSKVKKGTGIASVSPEVQASIDEFVAYALTEERLQQGIQRVFTEAGKAVDIKETGVFLRWVFSDICKEEVDVMTASGIEPKQVSGVISQLARKWFMEYLEKNV